MGGTNGSQFRGLSLVAEGWKLPRVGHALRVGCSERGRAAEPVICDEFHEGRSYLYGELGSEKTLRHRPLNANGENLGQWSSERGLGRVCVTASESINSGVAIVQSGAATINAGPSIVSRRLRKRKGDAAEGWEGSFVLDRGGGAPEGQRRGSGQEAPRPDEKLRKAPRMAGKCAASQGLVTANCATTCLVLKRPSLLPY